jgi:hypothetical protein
MRSACSSVLFWRRVWKTPERALTFFLRKFQLRGGGLSEGVRIIELEPAAQNPLGAKKTITCQKGNPNLKDLKHPNLKGLLDF